MSWRGGRRCNFALSSSKPADFLNSVLSIASLRLSPLGSLNSPLSHSSFASRWPNSRNNNSEQLELLEEKLRELAALPRGDSRSDDDRAVALSQVDALRKELALVCRAGLPSVVFGKVSLFSESERKGAGGRARESE